MRTSRTCLVSCALLLFALLFLSTCGTAAGDATKAAAEKVYYAIDIGGTTCGYAETSVEPMEKDGKNILLMEESMFLMLSLLGSEVNTEVQFTYHVDPSSGQFSYQESDIKQGQLAIGSRIVVERDTAYFTSTRLQEQKVIPLTPEVILPNPLYSPYLIRDFVDKGMEEKTYEVLEAREGEIQKTKYTKVGTEEIQLAGESYSALIMDALNLETGVKVKSWFDIESGRILKIALPNDRIIYLTDVSVVKNIKLAKLNDNIFVKVGESIADIPGITYMKVKASFEPTGIWITPQNLNVPGQRFMGTVRDNVVQGVFEIEHERYDGSDAPPFPPDFSGDESLGKFLQPEELIESDDPVLVDEAQRITKGSGDSWEAACRLSKWVAENIAYAIPGGITARKTYDTRSGECGAHSMLVSAFCRAVGIPARLVWGCMYVPNYGGAFGQHGWNEIYMGEKGWIPVDATAMEYDFVDSGHIRLGIYESPATAANPKEIEILDYRIGPEGEGEAPELTEDKYREYLGSYTAPGGEIFKVLVQNGALAVDIPDQMVIAFNDPHDEGLWYCKLSNRLYIEFVRNDAGKVSEMQLHELVPLQRQSGPEEPSDDVPEEFRPYLGKYLLAALQAEFTVLYKDNGLAIYDPLEKTTVRLQPPDENGGWLDEFNKNTIFFDKDDEGNIQAMNIDATNRFRRGVSAASMVEEVIEAAGLQEGIKRYHELKEEQSGEYFFSERSFNLLGYRLLGKEKIQEALEIFKLNAEAYPDSWNVYDSLGEAYAKSGNNELAIENYQKSLDLNPDNEHGKKMLEELQSEE
ncbi:MAG: hypothetical protein AMJ46_11985 [Latescibacteria bacterium DG_63]|nr:MAG: hypothetical protein AMJ46_11985 [Latescibacteria bacterium DG_63]